MGARHEPQMTTGQSRRRAAMAMAVVFIAGVVLGLAATRVYDQRLGRRGPDPISPGEYRQRLLQQLTADLALDPGQQEAVEEIMIEIEQRFREVRDAIEPEMDAIRSERAERIMALLDQMQRAQYESILEERRRHREERARRFERQLASP